MGNFEKPYLSHLSIFFYSLSGSEKKKDVTFECHIAYLPHFKHAGVRDIFQFVLTNLNETLPLNVDISGHSGRTNLLHIPLESLNSELSNGM